MTDTARSLAAIKALFADNVSAAISPQDLRDFVQSVVDPVQGGGFDTRPILSYVSATATLTGSDRIPLVNGDVVAIPIGNGNPHQLTYGVNKDPYGWSDNEYSLLGSDPDNSYGVDWVEGDAIMIPRGCYLVSISVAFESAASFGQGDTPRISCYVDQAQYNSDADFSVFLGETEPFWYAKYYNTSVLATDPPFLPGETATSSYFLSSQMIVNDEPDPQPFVATVYTAGQPGSNFITHWDYRIVRTA